MAVGVNWSLAGVQNQINEPTAIVGNNETGWLFSIFDHGIRCINDRLDGLPLSLLPSKAVYSSVVLHEEGDRTTVVVVVGADWWYTLTAR